SDGIPGYSLVKMNSDVATPEMDRICYQVGMYGVVCDADGIHHSDTRRYSPRRGGTHRPQWSHRPLPPCEAHTSQASGSACESVTVIGASSSIHEPGSGSWALTSQSSYQGPNSGSSSASKSTSVNPAPVRYAFASCAGMPVTSGTVPIEALSSRPGPVVVGA